MCVCRKLSLLMCGGGVRSILLLPIVARCLETIDYVYGACRMVVLGLSVRLSLFHM